MPSDTDGEKRKGLEDDSRTGFALRPPYTHRSQEAEPIPAKPHRAMAAASPPPLAERLCILSTPPSPPASLAPFPRKNSIRLKPGPLSSRVQPKRTCRTL